MSFVLLIFAGMWLGIGLICIGGVTLHDLRTIRRSVTISMHPHSRWLRRRPLVSVSNPDTIIGINKNGYKKIELSPGDQPPKGEYILTANKRTTLPKNIIKEAVIELNHRPKVKSIELPVLLESPTNLTSLFLAYRHITNDFLRKSRHGLGIRSYYHQGPTLTRNKTLQFAFVDKLYTTIGSVALLSLPVVVISSLYLAAFLHQADLFKLILTGFGLWMLLAIWSHGQLSSLQKLSYTAGLPVTLGYFLICSFTRSLEMLTHMRKAIFHGSVSLFVRVKDVLRIV